MEILSKKIMPYFQPIVSIDTGSIYGYEVLGRYADNDGKIKSLGGFFSDKNVSNEEMLEVDRRIREEALKKIFRRRRRQTPFYKHEACMAFQICCKSIRNAHNKMGGTVWN